MRKAFSILLLSFFLFNTIGYYFLFLVLDNSNRKEIQATFTPASVTETLRIPRSELKNLVFKENDNEILYKGEVYDIKDRSLDGDYIVFNCFKDNTEKNLLTGLDNQVKNNSYPGENKKQNDSSKNPVKDLYFLEKQAFIPSSSLHIFQSVFCNLPSAILLPLPLPPPEVALS
jgi:hypothetical protein